MFKSILHEKKFSKNEFLVREGQYPKGIFFINEGSIREYYLKDGKEFHTSFFFENDFVSVLESLKKSIPSAVNLVAMEDTSIYYIPKEDMLALYQEAIIFQEIGREILEMLFFNEKNYASLLSGNQPKERYECLVKEHPHLIQRVPLQYLASFLGMTRESLSRVRKRV